MTAKIVRRVRESLPEDSRVLGSDGLVRYRGGNTDPATATIVQADDGVQQRVPAETSQVVYPVDLVPSRSEIHMDSLAVCQIALMRLLMGMEIHRFDLQAYVETGDLQTSPMHLERVIFDHPRNEDEIDPMPTAAIVQVGEGRYEGQALETQVEEDTIDVFQPYTVLRKVGLVNLPLQVVVWSAHKEERRGIRAAMERTFLAERTDERPGRRVAVPEYFDRVVRCNMQTIAYPDTQEAAKANQWILVAEIAADVDVVFLVGRPGYTKRPTMTTEVVEEVGA